ncbi:MAG: hypothetical protein FJZ89_01685 [Chloroflexi bacterium]|nr:hypothetical protein [Chloroflexota bacterium]
MKPLTDSWLTRTLQRLVTPFRLSRQDLSLHRGWGRWLDVLLIICVLSSLALTPWAPPPEKAFATSTLRVPVKPWWPGLEIKSLPAAAAPAPPVRDPQAATLLAAGPPATVTVTANPTSLHANGSSTATITATVTDLTGTAVANGTMVGFTVTTGLGSFPYAYVESSDGTVTKTGGFLTAQASPQASGGDLRYSNATGDYVRWTFMGSAISLVHNTQDNAGIANVDVDGLYTTTVDMYSAAQTWQVETVLFNTLPAGTHTITVTVSGNKNGSSSGYYVFVDAFRSGTTTSGGNGQATATLTAGTTGGTATVVATALGSVATGTTTVVMGKVRNTRTGKWFADIQSAIDDTGTINGDTIAADAGTYTGPITITKGIALTGAGAASTTILGTSPAVVITANNSLLSGFTISNTMTNYGVHIKGANNVTVTNNIIRNNSWGVVVDSGASGALINSNDIFSNTEGIAAGSGSGASNAIIRDNNVYGNAWGIDLYPNASGARVFHNNIYGNTGGQGWDSGSANLWDDGYPSAGNYWGDYTGKDADTLAMVSGHNQSGVIFTTLLNSLVVSATGDGIGNTSYLVPGTSGARDYYPLMQPSGWVTVPTTQPAVGVPITFTIAGWPAGAVGQSLSPTSTNTGANGQAASQFTLGSKVGTYTITAQAAGAVGSPVTFLEMATVGQPSTITAVAVPPVIRADGVSTATITATVQDAGGNPVSNVTVGVTATRGTTGLPFVEGEGAEVTKSPGGAWTEVINPQASGGKYVQSNGAFYPTASASWTFTASTISLLYAKNSLGGIAAVQVDSSPPITIDMYSAVTTFVEQQIATGLSAGPHTITVRQTSPLSKNPSSGGYFIYVDAFRASGRTNANGQIVTWLRSSSETSNVTSTVRATALGSSPLFHTETQVVFAWPPAITFTAAITPVVLSCGITDTITATVSDGGYPIAGTVVTFAVSPSTLGSVSPITATTNVTGQAVTVFTANKVGTGVITATAAGISNTLPVTVNPGSPITPTLSASPGQLVATGSTTATVILTATDACGNLVANGTPVIFTTNLGSIAPLTSTTTNGVATAVLTSTQLADADPVTKTATITGTVYGSTVTGTTSVVFGKPVVPPLMVSASPGQLVATGSTTATVTITATDAFGGSSPDGTPVTFTTNLGSIAPLTSTTTNGVATAILTSARLADADPVTRTVAITGTAHGSIVTGTTSVVFGKPAVSLTVTPGKTTLVANGVDTTTLTANVRDAFGNPSPNGTLGGFAITPGFGSTNPVFDRSEAEQSAGDPHVTRSGWTQVHTYTAGSCTGIVVAYTTSSADVITYTFTGTAAALWYPKRSDYGVLRVWIDGSLAGVVTQTSSSATEECGFRALIADSLTSGPHVMTVTLQAGSGTFGVIDAFESGGAIKSGTGQLNGFLTAAGQVGTATITATASGSLVTNTTTVTFTVGPPLTVTLGQSAYTVTCGGPGSVTATVLAYGNNVVTDGTPVTFTTNVPGASFSPSTATTVNGVVTTTVWGTTATTTSGVLTATAAMTVFGTANLTVNPGQPGSLVLTRHPTSIPANNFATALITATVRDACGNLVANGTLVTFTTDLGTIVEGQPRLTSGGVATSTLRSGFAPGMATVTVTAGAQVSTTIVYFTGAPWTITVTAAPPSIPVGGATSIITAAVWDPLGIPISDGTAVTFTTTILGTIVETQPRLTSGGVATTTLASGPTVGTAIVTATADSRFGTTNVNFTPGPLDHFVFAPIGTQQAGVAFAITITAQDAYNNIATGYTGSNTLADSTATIVPTTTGNFVNGVWSGSVTILKAWGSAVITTTGSSKLGVSNPFTVTPGAPFTVTVTAFPTSIPIGGSTATVTATVRDWGGDLVSDGTVVTFATSLGTIAPVTGSTTNGVATATLISGVIAGTALVTATADSRSGSTNVTFTPGPAASVVLVAEPTSIPIGGLTAALTATVRDQYANLVANGTLVTFTTNLGSIAELPPRPTTGGVATATLTSGTLMGTATVTATVDAISGTTTVTFTPGLPFTVTLTANPASVPVGGVTSTLIATVTDQYTNLVADGTMVTFATSLGSVAPPIQTTTGGVAIVTLTSGNIAGTATVTATAGTAWATTPVTFTPLSAFTVTVTAAPTSIVIGGNQATITATVVDQHGNRVGDNTPVTFTTSLGSVAPPTRLTTGGVATTTLTSGNIVGTATVIALVDGRTGTTNVQFLAAAPFTVTVTASPTSIPVSVGTATITATVTDQYGNLAANGTVVYYQASLGGTFNPPTSTTISGIATSTLTAGNIAGTATVTATAGTAFGTTPVTFTAGAPFTVTLVASPTTTVVGTPADLTATVRDQFNNLISGVVVYYQASPGSTAPPTSTTSAAGVATSTVTSLIVGPTVVTATADSRWGTAIVTFTPGLPFTVTLVAVPPSIPIGGSTSTVTATVVDKYGNRVTDGTVVSFTTSLGSIAPPTRPTSNGLATVTLTSGNTAGIALVTATAGIAVGTLPVTFTAGPPFTVTVAAFPTSTVVGAPVVITAAVQDQSTNPVADGTVVTFTTSLGSIAPPTGTTTGGTIAAVLTSNVVGVAIVTATAGGRWGTTNVTFTPGLPFTITVLASPLVMPIGGYTSTVTATARDQYGNLVSDGTRIDFSTNLGSVSPPFTGTVNGLATTALTSGNIVGTARVYAYSGVASGFVDVTFTVGLPRTVIVVAQPPSIPVATGTAVITATVLDIGNNPVANGTLVTFTSSLGSIIPIVTTTNNGIAQATLNASTVAGTAVVTATAGTVSGTTTVVFMPGPPANMLLLASPTSIPIGGDTAAVTATIRDLYGNVVANGTGVSFATTLGTFQQSGSTIYNTTTTGGVALTTLVSGLSIGTAQVSAAAGVVLRVVEVTFTIGPPASVTVTASPPSISIVTGSSTVTATVRDAGNNLVADGAVVSFATSLGTVNPLTALTTNGIATTTLTAGTKTGTAIVTATVDAIWATTDVTFTTPYPPQNVVVTAYPLQIPADGVSTSAITATVTEIYGNPVADGNVANFFVTAGATIAPLSAPTVNGIVTATLTAGTTPTTVTVRVIVGSRLGEANVVLYLPPRYKLYLPVLYKNYGGGW